MMTLKTKSCHDANFVSLAAPRVFITTISGVASNGKIGMMTALGFHLWSADLHIPEASETRLCQAIAL